MHAMDASAGQRARTELNPGAQPEPAVAALLQSDEARVQIAALRRWAQSAASAADAVSVWQLVLDASAAGEVRTEAMRLLEQTHTFDASLVREHLHRLEPATRWYAARCLIAAGDARGIDALRDLSRNDCDQPSVRVAAARLLRWLAGAAIGADDDSVDEALRDGAWRQRVPFLPRATNVGGAGVGMAAATRI